MSQSLAVAPGTEKKPLLSNTQYNLLKHVASIGLPFLAALYYALGQIWHFPDIPQVMASIAFVNSALGGVLGYSTATYNSSEAKYAGVIEIAENDLKKVFSLNLNGLPEDLEKMGQAIFKIASTTDSPSVTNMPTGGTSPQ